MGQLTNLAFFKTAFLVVFADPFKWGSFGQSVRGKFKGKTSQF